MSSEMLLERYRLTETAGQGGFASVEVAWDTRLQRRVAVKRISLFADSDSTVNDGLLEARTAALLSDPNIVSILDFELTATEALIIMEYIDGPNLASLMRSSTELFDLNCVAAIARDVGNALMHAHENRVLHLDIKPANILFDPKGNAKVTDFGMAVLSARHGFGEPQGGTVGYMPPEQIVSDIVDERTDLWAFAILIYQLLVGNNPYLVKDADDSLRLIETLSIPLPSQVRDDLDEDIDRLFIAALSAEAVWRQASIREFLEALLPYLGSTRSGRSTIRKRIGLIETDESNQTGQIDSASVSLRERPRNVVAPTVHRPNRHFSGLSSDEPLITEEDEEDSTDYPDDEDERTYVRSTRSGSSQRGSDNNRPNLPLWLGINDANKVRIGRIATILFALATAFFGLTGFGLLGLGGGGLALGSAWRPVGGSIEGTIDQSPVLLSNSEMQTQLALLIGLLALVAIVTMIAPTAGGLVAMLIVCAGVLARGLVIIAALLFIVTVLWWLLLGRRGINESTLLLMTIPLAWMLVPFSLPIIAASLVKPLRAWGSVIASWLLLVLLSGLTSPVMYWLAFEQLFSTGTVIEIAHQQFPPLFWYLLTTPMSWISLLVWVLTCTIMLGFSKRKSPKSYSASNRQQAQEEEFDDPIPGRPSRLKMSIGAVLATIFQAAGLTVVPLLLGITVASASMWSLVLKFSVSLALVLILIQLGVLTGWSTEEPMDTDG